MKYIGTQEEWALKRAWIHSEEAIHDTVLVGSMGNFLEENPHAQVINASLVEIRSLLFDRSLNEKLYEAMEKANKAGETIYIISWDKEKDTENLIKAGADITKFKVISPLSIFDEDTPYLLLGKIIDMQRPLFSGLILADKSFYVETFTIGEDGLRMFNPSYHFSRVCLPDRFKARIVNW